MKYWRKMLLAVFAVCLFAGMAFCADIGTESICDPECFDGLMFIGDMFYDGCMPDMDGCGEECSVLNWPLDGALWDCDNTQFINQGFAWLDAQTYGTDDVRGLLPHRLAWSEKQHLMFVSYLSPWHHDPQATPWIDIFDLDKWRSAKFNAFTYGDGEEDDYNVGAMALDDERGLLYVTNLDRDDARLSIWDINGLENMISAGPTKVDTPEKGFVLCCEPDCDCEHSHNMDIIYFRDKLYVTYYDWFDYASWMVGVFDADPDSDTYGHQLKCFPLICDNEDGCCIDPKEGHFPASELAAGTWTDTSGVEHVLLFASFHPDYQGKDCYEEPDNTDCPWIREMAGTLAVIDPEGGRLLGVENFNDLSSKVYDFGLCDTDQWFDLRSIAWNPCACDETCQDGLLYVTAMKYGPEDHCHDGKDSVQECCHRHDVAMESYVLAFSYQMEDCNEYKWIRLEGMKTLPVREDKCGCGMPAYGCCHHECYKDHPWSPADIVATQWVPQIAVEVDVPLDASDMFVGGTVTVTYDYEGDDKNFTDNTLDMTLQYDPTLLSVDKTSVMVKLGGVEAALGAGFVTGDEGQVTLQNVLAPVSGILSDGDKLVVEVDMDVLATSTEETSILAYFDDPIGGYNCCMTYTPDTPGPVTPDPCCGDVNDDNVEIAIEEEPEGNEYEGSALYFQLTCSGDVTADPVLIRVFFEDCEGIDDLTNLYVWDDAEGEWVAFTGTVSYVIPGDEDWPEGASEDWECALFVEIAPDSDFCGQYFALSAETDAEDMNPADNGGGGGSGGSSSSSGCNVGFSAAALLFAIPLVNIFRKR